MVELKPYRREDYAPGPAFDEADAREVLAAIARVRRHLDEQWISEGCKDNPTFGCVSCHAQALDHNLAALANAVADDQGITLTPSPMEREK